MGVYYIKLFLALRLCFPALALNFPPFPPIQPCMMMSPNTHR